jgi:hypothetical protein
VLGGHRGVGLVDLVDQLLAVGLAAERAGDLQGLVGPGREPLGGARSARDRGRDRREQVVVLLGHPRVGADDEIRLERRDGFVLEPVGEAEDLRLGVPEELLGPRPGRERLVAVPVGHADGYDAELEQRVVLGVADADDPLRFLLHDGLAEPVLDGHREGRCALGDAAAVRSIAVTGCGRRLVGAARPEAQGGQQGHDDQQGGTAQRHGSSF